MCQLQCAAIHLGPLQPSLNPPWHLGRQSHHFIAPMSPLLTSAAETQWEMGSMLALAYFSSIFIFTDN